MDRQTRELSVLCILAAVCGMVAWALNRPAFIATFTVEAAFMATCLSSIAGRMK